MSRFYGSLCILLIFVSQSTRAKWHSQQHSCVWKSLLTVTMLTRTEQNKMLSNRNSIALQADYVTVVEGRPTVSVKYCLPVSVFHLRPKLKHFAAQSLCDCWATCTFRNRAT